MTNTGSAHNTFVWLHRWLGLTTMAFLIAAAVTGSVLVFRAQIDTALNADLFYAPSKHAAQDPAAIADIVSRAHPEFAITETPLMVEPGMTLPMNVTPVDAHASLGFDQIFVDPQNGSIVGSRQIGAGWDRRHLVEGIYLFHYTLLGGTAGRWFMGIVAALWTIANLIGLYLTFPRGSPFWSRWWRMWTVARNTRFARFCLDLHRAGGLWLFFMLLVISIISVEMNFYDEMFVPLTNAIWSPSNTPFDDSTPKPLSRQPQLTFSSAKRSAEALAANDHPGWVPTFATTAPQLWLVGVSFTRPRTDMYSGLGPVAYYFNAGSGAFVFRDDPYNDGARGAFMRSLYPLHAGRIFGWPTRILVFFLGVAITLLSLTGFYVWLRKRRRLSPNAKPPSSPHTRSAPSS